MTDQKKYYQQNKERIKAKKNLRYKEQKEKLNLFSNTYAGAYPEVDDLTGIPDFYLEDKEDKPRKNVIWKSWSNLP